MKPIVSLLFPVANAWSPLLFNTLEGLKFQTAPPEQFEAIIAIDGGTPRGPIRNRIKSKNYPFKVIIVDSPRPMGDFPHRNHARNAAFAASSGEIVWLIDCDQLMEDNAISTLIKHYKTSMATGECSVFIPIIVGCKITPTQWLKKYYSNFNSFFNGLPFLGGEYNGLEQFYNANNTETTTLSYLHESMPAVPRVLWEALGGLDESFVKWGGNKEEFSARLNQLCKMGWISVKLMPNVRFLHQPHAKDPGSKRGSEDRAINGAKFHRKLKDMQSWQPWWREQVMRVKQLGISPSKAHAIIVTINPSPDIARLTQKCVELSPLPIKHRNVITDQSFSMENCNAEILCNPKCTYSEMLAMAMIDADAGLICVILPGYKGNEPIDKIIAKVLASGKAIIEDYLLCFSEKLPINLASRVNNGKNILDIRTQITDPKISGWPTPRSELFIHPTRFGKPKLSIGILNYRRGHKLKECLDSLRDCMDENRYEYDVFVTQDDHHNDKMLQTYTWLEHVSNRRGGVSVQTNRILAHFNHNVQYGFIVNDDMLFLNKGWEDGYIAAMQDTPYPHFCYMDLVFERGVHGAPLQTADDILNINGIKLVNWKNGRIQGAFLTFDQRIIDRVGGMDAEHFGMCGHEHVDWTMRIARANLTPRNSFMSCYDVLGSNNYIKLNLKDYHPCCAREGHREGQAFFNTVKNNASRIYVAPTILRGDVIHGDKKKP